MKMWLAKQQAKASLMKAFRNGEVGNHYSYSSNSGLVYPKIHAVDIQKTKLTYVFTIPTGMDPKEIKKKEFCFKQVFGERIELKGDNKKFTLTVFAAVLQPKLEYNYKEIEAFTKEAGYHMPIVAGKDASGAIQVYDATNNPNLLIYGEPGSGKSSILHVILTTLIQFYSPSELHLHLADFKQNELCVYEGVDHVKSVSYQVKNFAPILGTLKAELIKRGELLKNNRVRHVNKLPKDKKPPYIVLCVDEFVMITDNDIMSDLLQIASLGRAYGIYLILSMQRPSHKILSTDVRGLLSVRMGFRTVDLRNAMIGETPGSEKIKKEQPGKFLLKLDELTEIQAPYLDENNVEKILEAYQSADDLPSFGTTEQPQPKKDDVFGVLD
ncbi:FtsK/SpoIIIE domain-containing protein [Peribacillus sp. 1P06PB]|uniref:FtsK/SpoIIIE domain-containing protein n=2 Tax=unclassified Peribacillus TaxID=2675266 RepID=UPI0039A125D7